jgi:hypothetical protein
MRARTIKSSRMRVLLLRVQEANAILILNLPQAYSTSDCFPRDRADSFAKKGTSWMGQSGHVGPSRQKEKRLPRGDSSEMIDSQ